LTILALAWPQIREKWASRSDEAPAYEQVALIQNPTRSDIIATDDINEPGAVSADQQGAGVFDFSERSPNPQMRKLVNSPAGTHLSVARPISIDPQGNPIDAQLINDNGSALPKKDIPDCKPEITAELKKPEPPAADEKPVVKAADSKGYILGPRGGCFIVTPTGSKKYVDRSLCASTAAAARQ